MADFIDHSLQLRGIFLLHGLVDFPQTKCSDGRFLVFGRLMMLLI
jgi:hypothetical protein